MALRHVHMRLIRLTPLRIVRSRSTITDCMHDIHAPIASTVAPPPPSLSFDDPRLAFQSKTTSELARAALVLKLCSFRWLVDRAGGLLSLGRRVIGESAVSGLLRPTFFRHFCAGEDEATIAPVIRSLQASGVGGILDYAAEADLSSEGEGEMEGAASQNVGRSYSYVDEQLCDENMRIFQQCIGAVHNTAPEGFAAIKLTALGNPKLLQRLSTCLLSMQSLFQRFDRAGSGEISHEQFQEVYAQIFTDGEASPSWWETLDLDGDGKVDYIEWSHTLQPQQLSQLVTHCRERGPVSAAALDEEELLLVTRMWERILTLADHASTHKVRLMIDAEQSYFQPAIDFFVVHLQQRYNCEYPCIFNTYQCYLKNAASKVQTDMQRAHKHGFHFAAKVVRGAYMVSERQRASEMGYSSPVCDTLEQTHSMYASVLETILSSDKSSVMIASHNQQSVEHTLRLMGNHNIAPDSGRVYFGQLLGMSDHLTFTLGQHGYKAYKYVPYGPVKEVVPYLLRRAQENSAVLGGGDKERQMIVSELKRRVMG